MAAGIGAKPDAGEALAGVRRARSRGALLFRRHACRLPRDELHSRGTLGPDAVKADLHREVLAFNGHVEVANAGDDGHATVGSHSDVAAPHLAVDHGRGALNLDVTRLVVDDGAGVDV